MIKASLQSIYSNPRYNTIREWVKLITITGGSQAIVQVIGLLSGVLVIRLLSVQEYAYYTIANTMLGTMTLLSDGGISTGVMAQGGKVWGDREKLGKVLITGLELRRKFAVISLIISIPILFYLLMNQGASWNTSLLISLALIPNFGAAISDSILEIVPKLHQEVVPLQRNQLNVSIGRLLLNGTMLFLLPWTFVAILLNGLPRMYGNLQLRKLTNKYIFESQPDKKIRKEILNIVKKVLPGSLYYCLSGQITIWLLTLFGSSASIANIGAVGRLAAVINLLNTIVMMIVIPRFSRLPDMKNIVLKFFCKILIILCVVLSLFLVLTYNFSDYFLWILGENYKNLNSELFLIILNSCIGLLGGVVYNLCTSRGWVMSPVISISLNILILIICFYLFDLSSIKQVLIYNIVVSVASGTLITSYGFFMILKK